MNTHFVPPLRRLTSWVLPVCLVVLSLSIAACGGDTNTAMSGNTTTGSKPSVTTVTIVESKGASGDVYTCDPATITVKKGDTVTFTNQTDEIQDFDQGDAQKAGVDFKMNLNQSTTATFNTPGTFVIKSEKGASITVTVQ